MKVEKVMHREAEWRSPDTPLSDIAKLMRDEDVGSVPIGENDRLIGMVTDRDICCRAVAEGRDIASLTARDVMSKGIVYCETDDDLKEAAELMEQKQIRRLPVINEKRRLVGMLSLGDIAAAAPEQLTGHLAKAVSAHH